MRNPFRKNRTHTTSPSKASKSAPESVGVELFRIFDSPLQGHAKALRGLLLKVLSFGDQDTPEEEAVWQNETAMLRLFALDWSLFQLLDDEPTREALRDEFWGLHMKRAVEDPRYMGLTLHIEQRMLGYKAILDSDPHNTFSAIGKGFALAFGPHPESPLFKSYSAPGTFIIRDTLIAVSQVLYEAGLISEPMLPT